MATAPEELAAGLVGLVGLVGWVPGFLGCLKCLGSLVPWLLKVPWLVGSLMFLGCWLGHWFTAEHWLLLGL